MRGKLSKAPGAGKSFLSDYRKFVDRGNVMDLAVAVIIGRIISLSLVCCSLGELL